ncbi:hypothetical protein L198_06295 [Cryptococcus wingfieldii CBS 7118]|uniref:Uncharacterized protein n=1 Tax=Cryptococcus wingfieldii CBS 7118 TaxID=1295528 RepID=A0A1E3IM63_9TREE|nr:hypothetical protein L198_06295 [Cryptococcus wingfieldii CBS 7118]ODN89608.1 hypothetical protein L198_06295 [Cryptococcus wingfieldii CBS 7118]
MSMFFGLPFHATSADLAACSKTHWLCAASGGKHSRILMPWEMERKRKEMEMRRKEMGLSVMGEGMSVEAKVAVAPSEDEDENEGVGKKVAVGEVKADTVMESRPSAAPPLARREGFPVYMTTRSGRSIKRKRIGADDSVSDGLSEGEYSSDEEGSLVQQTEVKVEGRGGEVELDDDNDEVMTEDKDADNDI